MLATHLSFEEALASAATRRLRQASLVAPKLSKQAKSAATRKAAAKALRDGMTAKLREGVGG